jgi:hypothetical protein
VYACRENNVWELDHTCPPVEAGASADASLDGAAETGPAFDASLDAPPGSFGGPGCQPLEQPDCELGLVLLCASGCCGCQDLYVCQNGWDLWGECTPDGGVQKSR